MFDYGDIIAYILLVLQDIPPPPGGDITFEIKDIIRRASEGKEVPVRLASGKHIDNKRLLFFIYNSFKIILDLSQKNPFYSILPEATLLSAVEEFACGIHRGLLILFKAWDGWTNSVVFHDASQNL
jgi:hypothetical protein